MSRQLGLVLAALLVASGCSDVAEHASGARACEHLVVFDSKRDGRQDVFLMNLESRALVNLTQRAELGARNWLADLSPGGSEIVFVSEDSEGTSQLYVMTTDGSSLRQLTSEPASYENPAWSTDGEWIAFEWGSDEGWALYTIRPDGTGLQRVGPTGVNLFHPSWAPDGRSIAVVTGSRGAWAAGVLSLDSGILQVVTEPGLGVGSVKWSPNGTTLALDGGFDSNMDLYLLELGSGRLSRLTRGAAVDARPEWSPDGSRLVFHSTRDRGGSMLGAERWEEFELYVLDLGTGDTERLTENEYLDGHPDWCWPGSGAALYQALAAVTN